MNEPLWTPPGDAPTNCNMAQFMAHLSARSDVAVADADELHRFSVAQPELFWAAVWDFCGVIGDKGSRPWLVDGDRMPGAQFFPQATLNFAENLLRNEQSGAALVFWGEDKIRRSVGWDELRAAVSSVQQAFSELGVKPGDRVAAVMPNMPEAIVGMLAASSLGAIWSSCSPDFGVQGVLDRFGQIEPKVLIACDGYYYNGKTLPIADKLEAIVQSLPSVERVVVVSYLEQAEEVAGRISNAVTWDQLLAAHPPRAIDYAQFPFSHPLYILFSSGTTGVPKCIVHSAGGTLLQHVKEHQLHCDLKPGERLFYFTTCGWMMWNWLASGLACGATLLLYDGSPFHPDGNMLFDYADAEKMTVFGTSAKYIDAVKNAGLRPRDSHDLSSVRMMSSTGSPLVPESFDFVYDAIKPDIHLASIAGGTDIVSCFVIGNPLKPVWRGEIQGPGLGLAVDVYDDDGNPAKTGKGELVCTKPFPCMPIGFWNDADGARYRAAYFERFPNIWYHGDFAEWTDHGGIVIHGRSDATLNPGGVRIGTAEIYRQVEQLDEIVESIVIGQDWKGDMRIVLFVVLADGAELDDALRERLVKRIRSGASPRHVPDVILQAGDIPRTKSGKITELAVRDVVHGREVKNKEALANPEALEFFRDRAELGR
ncbi:MAG: acetoacetate--CoA ligase [Hyphomicrobiales bacterium]|nr:acetoacetate--CoA ligase [Hyphomicrobiales bacterium]